MNPKCSQILLRTVEERGINGKGDELRGHRRVKKTLQTRGQHVQLSLQIRNKLISAEISQDVLPTRGPSRYKYINGRSLHIYERVKVPHFCRCRGWIPEWQSAAACAGFCQLSCSLRVNHQRPDAALSSDLKRWLLVARVPSDSTSTVNIVSLVETGVFLLPLYLQFLTSPSSYRSSLVSACLQASVLFMSSILLLGWCRMPVFASILSTTSLAKPHLQFDRAKQLPYLNVPFF